MRKTLLLFTLVTLLSQVVPQNPQCCTDPSCQSVAFNWNQLHISAGGSTSTVIAHDQDHLSINCIGGRIWDVFSGHPKFSLELDYNGSKMDITQRINNTNLVFNSTSKTDWTLVFTNHNSLWNANIDLIFNTGCQNIDLWSKGLFYCNQKCMSWCWATVLIMTWNYYKKGPADCVSQECEIVSASRQQQCCTNGTVPICSGTCNTGSNMNYVTAFAQQIEPSYYLTNIVEVKHLYTSLQQGHPVIAHITWQSGGEHVIIIGGVQCNPDGSPSFLVGDPWGPYGKQTLPYLNIASYTPTGSQGIWDQTVISDL